jgi:hypothetical protein
MRASLSLVEIATIASATFAPQVTVLKKLPGLSGGVASPAPLQAVRGPERKEISPA